MSKTTANNGFAAMPADEYILIFLITYQQLFRLKNIYQLFVVNFNFSFSIGLRLRAERSMNSGTAASPTVGCKFYGNTPPVHLTLKEIMPKELFICTLILSFSIYSSGQSVEKRIESFIKENDIDTFLIYSQPCIGYVYPVDTCQPKNTHYLLWGKDNEYFIKRFQTCHTSIPISLNVNNPLTYYNANSQTIDKEEIKQPTHYEYKKSRKRIDTIMVMTSIDHSCHHTFNFSLDGKAIEKSADEFDLDFRKFDSGEMNIYYDYNQQTKFKTLIDQTVTMVDTVAKKLLLQNK